MRSMVLTPWRSRKVSAAMHPGLSATGFILLACAQAFGSSVQAQPAPVEAKTAEAEAEEESIIVQGTRLGRRLQDEEQAQPRGRRH